MIEKRITTELLDTGEVRLTPGEATALELPAHSCTIDLDLEGENVGVQWSGAGRVLHGDMFTERLQDYGQVGGLLRIHFSGEYRLQLLPPGAHRAPVPPVRRPPTTPSLPAPRARRNRTADRRFVADDSYDWDAGEERTIGFLREARAGLIDQLSSGGFDPAELVELRLQGEELATLDDFEELLAVDVSNVDRMPHQEAVARQALSRLRGRAVLADEVGLGKTIEAGLAVKELTLRGLARRILVLCPAPLREQWREELAHKFELEFEVALGSLDLGNQDRLICSLQLAARNREQLVSQTWDIVIVDEAHRVAGAGAVRRRELVGDLSSSARYVFFLTATPVQNDLLELYRLVQLLRPGTFESMSEFRRRFTDSQDRRRPKDPADLRRLVSEAMVRTTRAQAGVDRVKRRPFDVPVTLGAPERELYVLCTQLLRSVMTGRDDTMRRRSLALRLTASPFSMGTTALRMSKTHPDRRVKDWLDRVGNLAMDIPDPAREVAALGIIGKWLRDHGRVLVFTQHTDTVTALLRRLDREGITATPFHGSMSPTERATSIDRFRSGAASVMVSTDAGAEGQNLQFCNCVVNYDLPWNPMRIEQRIGRVDRLTQPKDEVFVANLFARNTVDERVYQLLAEKLKMFELLFGQVTTILGELDESRSLSFEGRVLEAFLSHDDSEMSELLAGLGAELATARERANEMIATDSGLSAWLKSSFTHREGLTVAGADELRPRTGDRTRLRQARVQVWARATASALDAQLLHDTGQGRGSFVTIRFDESMADELGGRTDVHLAFDKDGLDHHPDAELCAVGAPVFEEMLSLLRVRGDIHVTVPDPPQLGPSPIRHSDDIELISRTFIPTGRWTGTGTFRASVGESEPEEQVVAATFGPDDIVRRQPRRALADGDAVPSVFVETTRVVEALEQAVRPQLEGLRAKRLDDITRQRRVEFDRIEGSYSRQIQEATGEEKARLERARESEKRRLSRRPDVRARAELLAIALHEEDWRVQETWRRRDGKGQSVRINYTWRPNDAEPAVRSHASGEPTRVATLCMRDHWIDESERAHCDSCASDLCPGCGPTATLEPCEICRRSACGACRDRNGGLCNACASPDRAPDLDTRYSIGWRVADGGILLVGARSCRFVRAGDDPERLVVPDTDVDDDVRELVRTYALSRGLPADTGLRGRVVTAPEMTTSRELVVHEVVEPTFEVDIVSEGSADIDESLRLHLTRGPDHDVHSERGVKLDRLLRKLRAEVPPPNPPAVEVTRRDLIDRWVLCADRLERRRITPDDDGEAVATVVEVQPLTYATVHGPVIADARLDDVRVTIERRHEAVAIVARKDGDVRLWDASPPDTSFAEQAAWSAYLSSVGMAGARVGTSTTPTELDEDSFVEPKSCARIDLQVKPLAGIRPVSTADALVPSTSVGLDALGLRAAVPREYMGPAPLLLGHHLLDVAAQPFSLALDREFDVTETWRGHGTATRTRRTVQGRVAPLVFDDSAETVGDDFEVCRDGHLFEPGTGGRCDACNTFACRACEPRRPTATKPCPGCARSACARCVATPHAVTAHRCEVCADHACQTCGRDPKVQLCPLCERLACASCRAGELCRACATLEEVDERATAALPSVLAASGARVWRGRDRAATVVLIAAADRRERAVVVDGELQSWVTYENPVDDHAYRLRLAASRFVGAQVVTKRRPEAGPAELDGPHSLLQRDLWLRCTWAVAEHGLGGQGDHRPLESPGQVDGVLLGLLGGAPTDPVPTHRSETPLRLRDLLVGPLPSPSEFSYGWNRTGRELLVTAAGLVERTFNGDATTEEVRPFGPVVGVPAWIVETLGSVAVIRGWVASGPVEVAVASLSAMTLLGTRVGLTTSWFTINESPEAATASRLAEQVGAGAAAGVATWTDPRSVRVTVITNATRVEQAIEPIGKSLRTSAVQGAALDASAAWGSVTGNKLEAPVLHGRLARDLNERFPSLPALALEIGAVVRQTVHLADGETHTLDTALKAGHTDARAIDRTTRIPLDSALIDREHHVVATAARCTYCDTLACTACADPVAACRGCGVGACGRCLQVVESSALCPACASIRPATRKEARQRGRLFSAKDLLVGSDAVHSVAYELKKTGWTVTVDSGLAKPVHVAAVIALLATKVGEP